MKKTVKVAGAIMIALALMFGVVVANDSVNVNAKALIDPPLPPK